MSDANPLSAEEENDLRAMGYDEWMATSSEVAVSIMGKVFATLDAARARAEKAEAALHEATHGLPEKIDVLARLYLEDNCYDLHDKKSRETLEHDGWQYVLPAYPVDHPESLQTLLATAMQSERVMRQRAENERNIALAQAELNERDLRGAECDAGLERAEADEERKMRLEAEAALAAAVQERDALKEAVIWMSGSDDFGPDGKAGEAFRRDVRPLLRPEAEGRP